MRHDIDFSLIKALKFAELEHGLGVASTYFVLLSTDFYNPASAKSIDIIHRIAKLGHGIGLHFDEKKYKLANGGGVIKHILRESHVLSKIIDMPISTVSMHRPTKQMLEANLQIPGVINSFSFTFIHNFKYLTDSR